MGINTKSEKIGRRDSHLYPPKNHGKYRNNKICNVALDTCTVYNMFRFYKASKDPRWTMDSRWSKKYKEQLQTFLEGNRLNKDGTFYSNKDKRRYVFWLMPTVQEEIAEFENKEFHEFVNKNMLKVEIDPDWQLTFDALSSTMAEKYAKAKCIHDRFGLTSNDGYLVGECSILNMPLISDDNQHLVGDPHNKVYKKKINKILTINREEGFGEFEGCKARPMTIGQFLSSDKIGNTPNVQNVAFFANPLRIMLEEKLEVAPVGVYQESDSKKHFDSNRIKR